MPTATFWIASVGFWKKNGGSRFGSEAALDGVGGVVAPDAVQMRRTGNTSLSPTIGMVTAGTANSGFAPACAAAGALIAVAPARAAAPVARIVLRSMTEVSFLIMAFFPSC